jgi:hypothetical protein
MAVLITKANGDTEPFDSEKLRRSLIKANAPEKLIGQVISQTESHLRDKMTTAEIYKFAFEALAKLEKPVAARYSLRRAILDLGPTGFLFEKFVAAILTARGYTIQTDVMVQGGCAMHEVDIIAFNDKELIMCEAKFHNNIGLQTDLKVALYVKARADDLRGRKYIYGGKEREITDFWLITNTKFTTSAISYAACKGLTLFGWNYPPNGNLHHMIEDKGYQPITCMLSLPSHVRQTLLEAGVLLCREVAVHRDLLITAGLSPHQADAAIVEARSIYNG